MNRRTEVFAYRASIVGSGLGALIILVGAVTGSSFAGTLGLAISVVCLTALFHLQTRLVIRSAEQQRKRMEHGLHQSLLTVSKELQRQSHSFDGVARDIEARITSRVPSARGFSELQSGIAGLIRLVSSLEAIVIAELDTASSRTAQSLGSRISSEVAVIRQQHEALLAAIEAESKKADRNSNRVLESQAKTSRVQNDRVAANLHTIREQVDEVSKRVDDVLETATQLDSKQAEATSDLQNHLTLLSNTLAESSGQLSDQLSTAASAQDATATENRDRVSSLASLISALPEQIDGHLTPAANRQSEQTAQIHSILMQISDVLDATGNRISELAPSVTETHKIVARTESHPLESTREADSNSSADFESAEVLSMVKFATDRVERLHRSLTEGFRATRVGLEQLPQTVEQYRHMHRLLASDQLSLPGIGGWAMTSTAIASVVARVLEAKDHPTVVELGSGISTVWLSLAMQRRGGGKLISLDHLEEYLDQTTKMVQEHGATEFVEMVHAPLIPTELGGDQFSWYDLSGIDSTTSIDILIVDGPPGDSGPQARYPALPLLSDQLADGASILVDDTIRQEEREVIHRWQQEFESLEVVRHLDKATLLAWSKA